MVPNTKTFFQRQNALKPAFASALATASLLMLASPSQGQEETGGSLWRQGGCFNCHGLMADGDGDAAYPAGPDLSRILPDRDALIETISCGRPGTPMPASLEGAYVDVSCYGLALGENPGVGIGAPFTAEQIETLADFLLEHVVGRDRVTRENCAAFYGGNINAPACFQYQ